ncbi:GldM family protein [Aureispira sp. CCB-QB1]|uniref:GldM family protein n=1 Tax=Aureispira sp. CCB-QB1 TaxID=1313421 RepID=UPI0006979A86|nr:GldM family protein [Aureispira sp. CCB-QB1]
MKIIISILAFICFLNTVQSQNLVQIQKAHDWLFVNFNNRLYLHSKKIPINKIKLNAYGCEIKNLKPDGSFILCPKRKGKIALEVYQKENNDSRLIQENFFTVKDLPQPIAHLGSLGKLNEKHEMKSGQFKASKKIIVELINYDFDIQFTIESYTIAIIRKNKLVYFKDCEGAALNMEEISKHIKVSERILITNIKFKSQYHQYKLATPLDIQIKNNCN